METKNIEMKLEAEIIEDLSVLDGLIMGSEECKTTVEVITKLTDRVIDLKKIEVDAEDKKARNEIELESLAIKKIELNLKEDQFRRDLEFKQKQLDNEKKDQLIRNGIAVAGIVIPSVITIWGTLKSLKFEETGTVTTIMGRGFIGKLLPKK